MKAAAAKVGPEAFSGSRDFVVLMRAGPHAGCVADPWDPVEAHLSDGGRNKNPRRLFNVGNKNNKFFEADAVPGDPWDLSEPEPRELLRRQRQIRDKIKGKGGK